VVMERWTGTPSVIALVAKPCDLVRLRGEIPLVKAAPGAIVSEAVTHWDAVGVIEMMR
jgi:hypothetical protein